MNRRNNVTGAAVGFALALFAGGSFAQSYYHQWSSYVGGDWFSDSVLAITADSQTNTYLGGYLTGNTIRNQSEIEAAWVSSGTGARDGFIAKVDKTGTLVWYVVPGYAEDDQVNGLAVHTNGVGYAVLLLNNPTDAGTRGMLMAFSTGTGAVSWFREFNNIGGTNGFNAVTVDTNGNVYAVGHTTVSGLASNVPGYQVGGVTYGKALKGNTDAFVAKFAPNGNRLWLHYLGGTNADAATCCALGPDGALYVGGETRSPGWTTVASGSPSPANPDGFIAKLTTDGTNVWSSLIGGSATDAVSAVACTLGDSALYLGGRTASTNFVAGAARLNQPVGGGDGFVLSLNDAGATFQTNWCRFVGGGAADAVSALALRADGKLTAGGATASSAWLPSADNTYRGGAQDGFLLRLDAGGNPLWSSYIGGANSDAVNALAAPTNALLVGGITFSPDNAVNWVDGGFWPDWTKDPNFGYPPVPDYTVTDMSYGLVAKWTPELGDPPTVTDPPDDVTVNEGLPAAFSVAATGYTPLYYRWFRNGQPLTGGPTSNVYALAAAARTNNQDVYTCLVSNTFGVATSQGAKLTVISNATLTVTLSPADAVAQGARWRLTGGTRWMASGASTNLAPGTYGVTFTNLTGWSAPAALASVALAEGQTTATSGVYAAVLPAASRTISGTNVTVSIQAPAGLSNWSLVETLQAGLTPTNITAGGVWNSGARTLTFTGSEAYTGTVSYTVICVTSGVYVVSGTITPQPANQPVAVTGDGRVLKGNFLRLISGKTVTITVYQPLASVRWYVYEYLPAGLTPTNIVGPAATYFDDTNEIDWYKRGVSETVSFEVVGEPGAYTLSGEGQIGSVFEPIFGDTVVTIAAPEPVPAPTILAFAPIVGAGVCSLTFTSVVNQAYVILTNAAPGQTNRWAACETVTGAAGATQRQVPMAGSNLFYRVRVSQ